MPTRGDFLGLYVQRLEVPLPCWLGVTRGLCVCIVSGSPASTTLLHPALCSSMLEGGAASIYFPWCTTSGVRSVSVQALPLWHLLRSLCRGRVFDPSVPLRYHTVV